MHLFFWFPALRHFSSSWPTQIALCSCQWKLISNAGQQAHPRPTDSGSEFWLVPQVIVCTLHSEKPHSTECFPSAFIRDIKINPWRWRIFYTLLSPCQKFILNLMLGKAFRADSVFLTDSNNYKIKLAFLFALTTRNSYTELLLCYVIYSRLPTLIYSSPSMTVFIMFYYFIVYVSQNLFTLCFP